MLCNEFVIGRKHRDVRNVLWRRLTGNRAGIDLHMAE